jgi:ABC-type Zn2+ transport system substrate-binding protein/surface adhesin
MRALMSYAVTIAAILLTAQAASAAGLFPKVVVTVAPLKPYVDEILAGHGEAQNLLRPGQDAHSFALTLPQAKMLDEADVIIVPDLAMSPFLARLLATKKKLHVVELTALKGAHPLPYASDNPWLEAAKEAAEKKAATKHGQADENADADAHHEHDDHNHAGADKGVNVARTQLILTLVLAGVIALAIKLTGILLITALLVIPAAAARSVARSPAQMAVFASVLGMLSVTGGLFAALTIDVPTAPMMVVVASTVFVLSSLIHKKPAR